MLLKLLHRLHCSLESAWAYWVRKRASLANLEGDLFGEHWNVLRSLLPLYQAITVVDVGDGRTHRSGMMLGTMKMLWLIGSQPYTVTAQRKICLLRKQLRWEWILQTFWYPGFPQRQAMNYLNFGRLQTWTFSVTAGTNAGVRSALVRGSSTLVAYTDCSHQERGQHIQQPSLFGIATRHRECSSSCGCSSMDAV